MRFVGLLQALGSFFHDGGAVYGGGWVHVNTHSVFVFGENILKLLRLLLHLLLQFGIPIPQLAHILLLLLYFGFGAQELLFEVVVLLFEDF